MTEMTTSKMIEAINGHAHWHGFTQMSEYESLVIENAAGCWLTTKDGRRLLDGVSSLWCNVHGHRNPHIDAAIADQLRRVAHVTTLGMSSATTDSLAQLLVEITPGEIIPVGDDHAIDVGSFVETAADGSHKDHGKYVAIWAKVDGSWKMVRDIWNSSMP